jgi:flavin reductase ActVB
LEDNVYDTVVDSADFRQAMSQFPSGVTIVTTPNGSDCAGFTASAFSSLSLNPPLVLVCLQKDADCYEAFAKSDAMGISILAVGQTEIAMRFATRGADKFGPGGLFDGELTRAPLVHGATVHLECEIVERPDGGDHTILVGKVLRAKTADVEPMIHYNRKFGRHAPD